MQPNQNHTQTPDSHAHTHTVYTVRSHVHSAARLPVRARPPADIGPSVN